VGRKRWSAPPTPSHHRDRRQVAVVRVLVVHGVLKAGVAALTARGVPHVAVGVAVGVAVVDVAVAAGGQGEERAVLEQAPQRVARWRQREVVEQGSTPTALYRRAAQ